jgi:hypothetical protein
VFIYCNYFLCSYCCATFSVLQFEDSYLANKYQIKIKGCTSPSFHLFALINNMGNNDSKETAPPVFESPKGMMADLLLEGDFKSSSSSSVSGGGMTFGGVHEIVGDKDEDDDVDDDVNEDEEAKKMTDKGGNEKGVVKVAVDVKTFSANFDKYINLLDGVEGWLTRLVPAPSNS